MVNIGILNLQGDVIEHIKVLEKLNCNIIKVKVKEELNNIDALIIPGGESTTIGKLLERFNLLQEIKSIYEKKKIPILGTCAGMILLAKEIINPAKEQIKLDLMDIKVRRNAFGRQKESFEIGLNIKKLGNKLYKAVFIRAPIIEEIGEEVEVLGVFDDKIILAQQDNMIACAFHPELTDDERLHQYFLSLIKK